MRKVNTPRVDLSTTVLPVENGGTGANTLALAAVNLNVVTSALKDMPSGVISLGNDGKISAAATAASITSNPVNIDGNFNLTVGTLGTYVISDYDSFKTYNVSISTGTVNVSGDTITYTAPATAQTVTLTVNGRNFTINVVPVAPAAPTLTMVFGGGVGNTVVDYVTSSAFSIVGSADTHLNTDWQIATDAAFTNIVAQSMADATNKLTWMGTGLGFSTTYYVRARHRTNVGGVSAWSATISSTTAASYTISTEEAKLTSSDRVSGDQFGYSVSMSSDGSRVVVGSHQNSAGGTSQSGSAYVFVRTGLTWTQEQKLQASDKVANAFFGRAVAISDDGSRVAVSAPGDTSNKGAVYIYSRSGSTWTQEQKVTAGDGVAGDYLGDLGSLAIDGTASRLVVGTKTATVSSNANAGAVYVFSRSGSVWTQEQKITEATPGATFNFGAAVDISNDGTLIVIGSPNTNYSESGVADQVYTTPGTYTFTVPVGVTSVSAVAIGAGGGAYLGNSNNVWSGGGGALAYVNNLPVTPGQQITVVVGGRGINNTNSPLPGGASQFGAMVAGGGQNAGTGGTPGAGGVPSGSYTAGYSGGAGQYGQSYNYLAGAAATYTANGTTGGNTGTGIYGPNGVNGGYGKGDNANYYAPSPANSTDGAVRVVWGGGKTYPNNSTLTNNQGTVYVYSRSGSVWTANATIKASTPTTSGQYGSAVSISGDKSRIAVSAVNTASGTGMGQVYVYSKPVSTWTEESILTGSSRVASDLMGRSISLNSDGSVIAIGESNATFGGTAGSGAIYSYTRVNVTWSLSVKLSASDKIANGFFGASVDINDDGTRIASGSVSATTSSIAYGAAYIYRE